MGPANSEDAGFTEPHERGCYERLPATKPEMRLS